MVGMDGRRDDSTPRRGDGLWHDRLPLSSFEIEGRGKGWGYLTFLMAMMKKQPMMANAMDVGNAKL